MVDLAPNSWKCNEKRRGEGEEGYRMGTFSMNKVEENCLPGSSYGLDVLDPSGFFSYDHSFAGLNCSGSQEPGERSQAIALDFVDKYLETNNVDLTVNKGKKFKAESSSVLSAKGPQTLAKRINHRISSKETGVFEWDDNQKGSEIDSFSNSTNKLSGWKHQVAGAGSKNVGDTLDKVCRSSGNESGYNEVDPHMEESGLDSGSSFLVQNSRMDDSLEAHLSEKQLEENGTMEDIVDLSDAFFNTQMAAEVMESLCYGLPNDFHANNADQQQEHTGFLNGIGCDIASSENRGHRKRASPASRGIPKGLNRIKNFADKSGKSFSTVAKKSSKQWELNPELSVRGPRQHKLLTKNNMNCCFSPHAYEMFEKSSTTIEQTIGEGIAVGTSVEEVNQAASSISARQKSHGQGGRQCKRKGSTVLSTKEKQVKSSSNMSRLARNKKHGRTDLIASNCLKLEVWSHPRRKRTSPPLGSHPDSTIIHSPFVEFNKINCNGPASKSYKRSRYSAKTPSSNSDMERKQKPVNGLEPVPYPDVLEKGLNVEASKEKKKETKQTGSQISITSCSTIGSNQTPPHHNGYECRNLSCNKNPLHKSSLIRELIQLGVPELLPNSSSKHLRRRRDMANVRVLLSQHLDEGILKQQKKMLGRLGMSMASSSLDSTHFITDKFTRTRNMLEAIALGKPVVTHLWLESCSQASCLIDEKGYILRDARKEKEIGFSMPVSLARASCCPLLKDQKVFITANIKPDKEMIASLVKAVQGQALESLQPSFGKDEKDPLLDVLILSCEEDYGICVPFLKKGAAIYSAELLLHGIVIQKLELERHRLFLDHV